MREGGRDWRLGEQELVLRLRVAPRIESKEELRGRVVTFFAGIHAEDRHGGRVEVEGI